MANAIDPEGVRISGKSPEEGWVSLTTIKAFDILSEGPIEGMVTGIYTFSGTMGNIGWTKLDISGYDNPPNTISGQFLRSIFWNEVPVVNSENKFNFTNVDVSYSDGSANNSVNGYITDELTVSRSLNERLRFGSDFAKIYRIYNNNCKAVIVNVKFNSMSQTDSENNTTATTVNYNIYYRKLTDGINNASFQLAKTESVVAQISQGYIRSSRIDLPSISNTNDIGYEIKIQRTTTDATNLMTRNASFIDSITEVYGNSYSYPYSAIVKSQYTAESFSQIPSRAFDVKLLKVRIPNNYDPLLKTYNGDWDGTWKKNDDGSYNLQWTDNPAWCFYDLITNKRYGLGNYIDESLVDKWTLYEISQYCDTLVPDGYGDVEPRFTCNLLLSSREEAYKVINDMASIFRAMTYYCGGSIFVSQDRERNLDNIFSIFTNANVEDGNFTYSSSSRRVRHTVAVVRYNDKKNFHRPTVEYVEDVDGIKRYGIREVEITAYGCTSRGQAVRYGRWALLSEILQTESVNFIGGYEAGLLRPGDIFKIVDFNKINTRYAGRTLSITNNNSFSDFKLDNTITGFVNDEVYKFSILTPSYTYDPALVSDLTSADINNVRRGQVQNLFFSGFQASGISGNTYITCVTPFTGLNNILNTTDYSISGYPVWSIEAFSGGNPLISDSIGEYYKALRIEEKDNFKFNVSAVEYAEDKYIKIESGLAFELPKTYYTNPPSVYPVGISLETFQLLTHTQAIKYTLTTNSKDISELGGYYIYAKQGSAVTDLDITKPDYLVNILPNNLLTGMHVPSESDTYYFRAHSFSLLGTKSASFITDKIEVNTDPILDVQVSELSLKTGYFYGYTGTDSNPYQITRSASPVFKWKTNVGNMLSSITGIQYMITVCPTNDTATVPTFILYQESGFVPEYTDSPEYLFHFNKNAFSSKNYLDENPPYRNYDIFVEALDASNGKSSAKTEGGNAYDNSNGFTKLHVTNPQITGFSLTTDNVPCVYNITTNQRLTSDGDLRIDINNFDNLPSDLAGGFVYFSDFFFDKDDLLNYLNYGFFTAGNSSLTIQSQKVNYISNANYIPMNPPLTGRSYGYLALTLFDTYEKDLIAVTGNSNVEKRLYLPDKSVMIGGFNTSSGPNPPPVIPGNTLAEISIEISRTISTYRTVKNIPYNIENGVLKFQEQAYPSWISINSNKITFNSSVGITNPTFGYSSDDVFYETLTDANNNDTNFVVDQINNINARGISFTSPSFAGLFNVIRDETYSIRAGDFYNCPFVFLGNSMATSQNYLIDWEANIGRLIIDQSKNTTSFTCGFYSFSYILYNSSRVSATRPHVTAYKRFIPVTFTFDSDTVKKVNNSSYTISKSVIQNPTSATIKLRIIASAS